MADYDEARADDIRIYISFESLLAIAASRLMTLAAVFITKIMASPLPRIKRPSELELVAIRRVLGTRLLSRWRKIPPRLSTIEICFVLSLRSRPREIIRRIIYRYAPTYEERMPPSFLFICSRPRGRQIIQCIPASVGYAYVAIAYAFRMEHDYFISRLR